MDYFHSDELQQKCSHFDAKISLRMKSYFLPKNVSLEYNVLSSLINVSTNLY